MKALLPIPEGASVCCAGTPEVIAPSLPFGEILLELMRLRPRTGHNGDLDVFLKRLVEDTRLLFGATGAAVALLDGQVCRWREKCGETGPQIGGQLSAGSGISGQCLASDRVQFCEDTLTDARFDAEVCQQLRIRSMIVAPIRCPGRVEGILEAWSSRALAFDRDCTETLQKLADFSGRVMGPGQGFGAGSRRTLPAVVAQRLTSLGRKTLQRTKELAISMHAKMSSAPAESVPLLMKLRIRRILPGVLLSTILGAAWHGAASVGSLPSSLKTLTYLSTRATLVNTPIDTLIPAPVEAPPRPQRAPQLPHKRSRPAGLISLRHGAAKKPEPLLGMSVIHHQDPVIGEDAKVPPFGGLGNFGGWEEDTAPLGYLLSSTPVKPRSVAVPPIDPEISVKKGHPLLAGAAIAAVKRWRYQPFLLDHSQVPMTTQISVKFKLK